MNLGAAREQVRVARALPGLPKISHAFRAGRVSFSKVRAMTRVATKDNEDVLLNVALGGAASHVERQVRLYRNIKRGDALKQENLRYAQREMNWFEDDNGSWVFKGRFTPEQGALIRKALDTAMDQLFIEQRNVPDEVSAETSRSLPLDRPVPQGIASRRADALQRLAEVFLSRDAGNISSTDNYVVNIHTEMKTLQAEGAGAESALEDSGHVSAETSRRLTCDCSVVHWRDAPGGEPLSVGRKPASFHRLFVAPYTGGMAAAASPVAPAPALSMRTTSRTGQTAVKLRWKTSYCCVVGITGWCMKRDLVCRPGHSARSTSLFPVANSYHRALHQISAETSPN